jgi:hypothetical protein
MSNVQSSLRDERRNAMDLEPSDESLGYFRSSLRDGQPARSVWNPVLERWAIVSRSPELLRVCPASGWVL